MSFNTEKLENNFLMIYSYSVNLMTFKIVGWSLGFWLQKKQKFREVVKIDTRVATTARKVHYLGGEKQRFTSSKLLLNTWEAWDPVSCASYLGCHSASKYTHKDLNARCRDLCTDLKNIIVVYCFTIWQHRQGAQVGCFCKRAKSQVLDLCGVQKVLHDGNTKSSLRTAVEGVYSQEQWER